MRKIILVFQSKTSDTVEISLRNVRNWTIHSKRNSLQTIRKSKHYITNIV